jgi:hypothetical protein
LVGGAFVGLHDEILFSPALETKIVGTAASSPEASTHSARDPRDVVTVLPSIVGRTFRRAPPRLCRSDFRARFGPQPRHQAH